MTLLEVEQRRSRRAQRKHQKQSKRKQKVRVGIGHNMGPSLAPLPDVLYDDRVLTFLEWIALCAISQRTGRRILAGPDGPAVVQLSPRRIGIRLRAAREWLQARERA